MDENMKTRILALTIVIIMLVSTPFTVFALEIVPQMYTEDINEYNTYTQENDDLPVNFVNYHTLSAFGAFHSFCLYGSPDELQNYYYVIDVQEGISVVVSIYEDKCMNHNLEVVDLSQIDSSMLYIKEPKSCIIESEGFIYEYYDCGIEKGKLAGVSWNIGNLTFTIGCSSNDFNNLSPDSLLGQILSPSKADHRLAMNEIKRNIISDWLQNNVGIIILLFFMLIISAAVLIVIYQRHRRKNNSTDL